MTAKRYFAHKKCNICGNSNNKVILNLGEQNLVRCSSCNLFYLNKQKINLENLYNENYFFKNKNDKTNCFNYYGNEQLLESDFKFAYNYINNNYKKYNLLDVGAGCGDFLKYLPKDKYFEAVEVSKYGTKRIREMGIKVYEDDFINAKIEKKFDIITSFDVIEHQILLDKYLNKINDLLKKDGIFIFTTPDYGTIFNKIFGKRAPAIQPLYHNYYFDKQWIKKMFPSFGFELVDIRTTYLTRMTLGHILLIGLSKIPFIKNIPILKAINKYKIFKNTIPFFRFGGINAIYKKI